MTAKEFETFIPEFISCLEKKKKSAHTLKGYGKSLNEFCGFLNKSGYSDITSFNVAAYVDEMVSMDYQPSTIHVRYAAITAFQTWMLQKDKIDEKFFDTKKISVPPIKQKIRKVISQTELDKILKSDTCLNGNPVMKARNQAVLQLLFTSGIRRGECESLNIEDVDMSKNTIKVIGGKGGKDRAVAIPQDTVDKLRQYLLLRKYDVDTHALFLNDRGERLSNKSIYRIVQKATENICHDGSMGAHATRHYYITALLNANVPVDVVQNQAGHSTISQTLAYSDGVRLSRAKAAVDFVFGK